MNRTNRYGDGTAFTAGAKVVSLLFVVGMVALLAGHTAATPSDDTRALATAVTLEPTQEIPMVGLDLPLDFKMPEQDAAAVQDDPPIATF